VPAMRLCLEPRCGHLTYGSRCADHERERQRNRWADKPIAAAVVAASPVCSCQGCGLHAGACNSTEDLTADHVVSLARGGNNQGKRAVLCRPCNASKGAGPATMPCDS
jgi:5-methylcytosine-specific restriction endonuclease McrA